MYTNEMKHKIINNLIKEKFLFENTLKIKMKCII